MDAFAVGAGLAAYDVESLRERIGAMLWVSEVKSERDVSCIRGSRDSVGICCMD